MHLNTLKIFDREIRCKLTSLTISSFEFKFCFVTIAANEATGPKIGTSLEKVMMSTLRQQINYTDNSEIVTTGHPAMEISILSGFVGCLKFISFAAYFAQYIIKTSGRNE